MTKIEELCKNNDLKIKIVSPDINPLSNDWYVLLRNKKTHRCFKFVCSLEPNEKDILCYIDTFLKMFLKIGDTVVLSDGFTGKIDNQDSLMDVKNNKNYTIERVY